MNIQFIIAGNQLHDFYLQLFFFFFFSSYQRQRLTLPRGSPTLRKIGCRASSIVGHCRPLIDTTMEDVIHRRSLTKGAEESACFCLLLLDFFLGGRTGGRKINTHLRLYTSTHSTRHSLRYPQTFFQHEIKPNNFIQMVTLTYCSAFLEIK